MSKYKKQLSVIDTEAIGSQSNNNGGGSDDVFVIDLTDCDLYLYNQSVEYGASNVCWFQVVTDKIQGKDYNQDNYTECYSTDSGIRTCESFTDNTIQKAVGAIAYRADMDTSSFPTNTIGAYIQVCDSSHIKDGSTKIEADVEYGVFVLFNG